MFKSMILVIAAAAITYYYLKQPQRQARVRKPQELNASYDYVIVGGGTAGCVLAARLSEDSSVSVLVLEAGSEEDQFWFSHIPGLVARLQMTEFDWQYVTEPQEHCCSAFQNKQVRWPRAKGLGGCSTHNYMNWVRGSPKDYEHWAYDLGNDGWSYKDLLPYFKKMEKCEIDYLRGRTDYHGYDGPMKVNIPFRTPLGLSFSEAIKNSGYKFLDDTNGAEFDGFSFVQFNVDEWGRRMSAARVYLRPAMERPNLHVAVHAHVTRVTIEPTKLGGLTASGVMYFHENTKYIVKANKEVILAGGAVNTPQLLLLSGIGPKKQLERFSIPVLLDNPAVGTNLHDHIFVFMPYKMNASGLTPAHTLETSYGYYKELAKFYLFGTGALTKTTTDITGFINTGLLPNVPKSLPDVQLFVCDPSDDPTVGFTPGVPKTKARSATHHEISFSLAAGLLHPSDRGQIRLRNSDPFAHPIIEHHYLKTSADVDALVRGLRTLMELAKRPELEHLDAQHSESGRVLACDKYEPLSDEYLKCIVRHRAKTLYHPVGTCRMGKKGENSVVDNELTVYGVGGLRVVDASVFPDQVSGNTHVPVLVVAEKAADLIKKGGRRHLNS